MKNSFIDDKEKMIDFFNMYKNDFLKFYSYLDEEDYINTVDNLWEKLSDIPINKNENIDENFYIWKKGTNREIIWHWFDERIENGIGNRYFN